MERDIITNPFFFGKEKIYLRAQIARISHGTTVVPRGLFALEEAEEEGAPQKEIKPVDREDEEAGFVHPETENQCSLANWLHFPKAILLNNRTDHLMPEVPEGVEAEPEDLLKEIVKKDPYVDRLKPVSDDEGGVSWTVRLKGEQKRQTVLGKKGATSTEHYGVVVLKSLRWPASVTCWKGRDQIQIYVGNGLKNDEKSYYPVFPPEIPVDPVD